MTENWGAAATDFATGATNEEDYPEAADPEDGAADDAPADDEGQVNALMQQVAILERPGIVCMQAHVMHLCDLELALKTAAQAKEPSAPHAPAASKHPRLGFLHHEASSLRDFDLSWVFKAWIPRQLTRSPPTSWLCLGWVSP